MSSEIVLQILIGTVCVITDNASRVIPSKTAIVNSQEPPWMNCTIKKESRRRKRLYKKAKLSNNVNHWSKFKSVRNNVISNSTEQIKLLSTIVIKAKIWVTISA